MSEFRHWTGAEDAFLWAGWADGLPVDQVAKLCNRTVSAVRNRAKERGLKRPLAWTPWADDALRAEFGRPGVNTRVLALRLGKSYGAVKQRAARLGLKSYRWWSRAEKRALRARYGKEDAAGLARDLGKTVRSVYQNAKKLGLVKCVRWPAKVIGRVKALNAAGLCDREIAARLRKRLDQVKHIRRRFGLPRRPDRDARRRSIENQRRTCGVKNSGELRAWSFRKYAREQGWPEDLRPREVQVLNVLADGVPRTKRELAAAIGMRADHDRAAKVLCGNGPGGSYTATLMRRGLATCLGRIGPRCKETGKGNGVRLRLYTLGPAALAILQERAKCQTGTAPSAIESPATPARRSGPRSG